MILCVTPNPTIDRNHVVPGYGSGGVFRPIESVITPGGKGIIVARAVAAFGNFPLCAGFLAGHPGQQMIEMMDREGLPHQWTLLAEGETRTCTVLVDPERNQTTVINEPGPQTTADDWGRLQEDVLAAAAEREFVCICGSLTPGTPPDAFARLVRALGAAGKHVWVDSSGLGLTTAVKTGGCAIKVNGDEIGALLSRTVSNRDDAAQAATMLHEQINAPVAVTLGADGAVLAYEDACYAARPPAITAVSAVGSGDSFLAGLLLGFVRGHTPPKALRQAVAAGAANALSLGAGRFSWGEFEAMWDGSQVERL